MDEHSHISMDFDHVRCSSSAGLLLDSPFKMTKMSASSL